MGFTETPCIIDGCYQVAVYRSRCVSHPPEAFVTNDRKARLPKDWNYRREMVLRRDKGVCYLCGENGADGVDHVVIRVPDDHSLGNLKAVHDKVEPFCHRAKTSEEGNEAQKQMRPKANKPKNIRFPF